MNLVTPILNFGLRRAQAPALVDGRGPLSYGELTDAVRRTAAHLAAVGLRRGDRVGLWLNDSAEHVVALLACGHLGAVAVPLDWRATAAETSALIEALDLAAVIAEPVAPALGGIPLHVADEAWREAVARAPASMPAAAGASDLFAISASSGSTGAPKLTTMSHLQTQFAVFGMWELMGLSGRHRFLCNMPLYYSGGRNSCLAHLLRGDCVVLHPSLFDPADYVEAVARHAITVGGVVPSSVRQLLRLAGETPLLPGLSLLFSTGAPLSASEKLEAARRLSPSFHERYGTAETMAVATLRPSDFAQRPHSVGQPHSLVEVEVVDEQDRPVPVGEDGLLRIRGPGVGRPLGAGAQASFRDDWFVPGEIARLDEPGYIFLQGRASDVIMRSGAKVHPAEIEAALSEHRGVAEAAVIGVRGDDNEETVVAFVVRADAVTAGELLAHCRRRLSAHKAPRAFYFLEALPRNTAGKVDKRALVRKLD